MSHLAVITSTCQLVVSLADSTDKYIRRENKKDGESEGIKGKAVEQTLHAYTEILYLVGDILLCSSGRVPGARRYSHRRTRGR